MITTFSDVCPYLYLVIPVLSVKEQVSYLPHGSQGAVGASCW